MSDIDPHIQALAEEAIRDLVSEVGRVAIDGRRAELVDRLAKALVLALEQEYQALAIEFS